MFRILSTVLVATALTAGVADAKSVTFGHRIDHEPNTAKPCIDDGSDTPDLSITCTRIPVDTRAAVPAGLTAPSSGRITKFKIRPVEAGQVTFNVVRKRNGQARTVGAGLTVNLAGPQGDPEEDVLEYPVETFRTNMKVKKGDYVGITSSTAPALYCSHGGDNQLLFTPALGSAFQTSSDTDSCELLVQAVMKKQR
jgi:hypothetical protein